LQNEHAQFGDLVFYAFGLNRKFCTGVKRYKNVDEI